MHKQKTHGCKTFVSFLFLQDSDSIIQWELHCKNQEFLYGICIRISPVKAEIAQRSTGSFAGCNPPN